MTSYWSRSPLSLTSFTLLKKFQYSFPQLLSSCSFNEEGSEKNYFQGSRGIAFVIELNSVSIIASFEFAEEEGIIALSWNLILAL